MAQLELPFKMMKNLRSVRIERFKRIVDAPFDLGRLNVLVGANNSGKSSIIQGLHFAIGLLQSINLTGKFPASSNSLSTSLAPNQLIYSPSDDVYALGTGARIVEDAGQAIRITLNLDSGDWCTLSIRKGRNRNLLVSVENAQTARQLSSLERPFSIFSPGLAGIAKTETFLSDGVLLRTLARGDANLVLRNILLRLWNTAEWNSFILDLHELFPDSDVKVKFAEETDEFINVQIKVLGDWVPLELAGTGILQAVQILSYIHRFAPSLVVLDEPDSHLHPNNQRLLCALLRQISEERPSQILLTTHSRHVVDAVGRNSGFLWVREGFVDSAGPDDEVGVLLDIGALDIKERAGNPDTEAVVLTEDENTRGLDCLLRAAEFEMKKSTILSYYGVTGIKQLRPLVQVIRATNPDAKIILHRDQDFLSESEVEAWSKQVRALDVEPFVTTGVDVDSHFLNAEHLSELNSETPVEEFAGLIDEVRKDQESRLIEYYVNGKVDIARKNQTMGQLDIGKLATEAQKAVKDGGVNYHHGKTVLKALRSRYQTINGKNLRSHEPTEHIRLDQLATVAKKAFGSQSPGTAVIE